MLALCLMLLGTYYAQNYAGIIGASLILSTSQCELFGARLCAHTRKTIPLAPIYPFTKQMVPSLCPESLTPRSLRSFSPVLCMHLIKGFLPSITDIFTRALFFSFFLSFSSHTFSWACGSFHEPRKFFSFCAFTCLSNHSLIS